MRKPLAIGTSRVLMIVGLPLLLAACSTTSPDADGLGAPVLAPFSISQSVDGLETPTLADLNSSTSPDAIGANGETIIQTPSSPFAATKSQSRSVLLAASGNPSDADDDGDDIGD